MAYRFTSDDADHAAAALGKYFGDRFTPHTEVRNYGFDLWLSIALVVAEEQYRWGVRYTFDSGDLDHDAAARAYRDSFQDARAFLEALAAEAAGKMMRGVADTLAGQHVVSMHPETA